MRAARPAARRGGRGRAAMPVPGPGGAEPHMGRWLAGAGPRR